VIGSTVPCHDGKTRVDRHPLTAHQVEFVNQKHGIPVRRLERGPVVFAKVGDCSIANDPQMPTVIAAGKTICGRSLSTCDEGSSFELGSAS
jgi:hypothetical protein